MQPVGPYNEIRLVADSIQRCVTLIWPTEVVERLLPVGMRLGEQCLTPPGTHPVNLFFHDMIRVHMNTPTLLPHMTYNEHVVGIPFVYTTRNWLNWVSSGPFYYMPILLLDDVFAMSGGRLWWGFPKSPARFRTTRDSYLV
ncbi:MAG: acetoacetate decarboxylase family protein, partial [Polyangiaceae bacterium]|nr:acetoacetate decarboxylase family protein [Polyangiaceae bacterium]